MCDWSVCHECTLPCDRHLNYPSSLLSRIDAASMLNEFQTTFHHVLLVTPGQQDWPKRVEEEESGVISALEAAAQGSEQRILLTACDGPTDNAENDSLFDVDAVRPAFNSIEIWSFPEACRYIVSDQSQLPALMQHIRSVTASAAASQLSVDIPIPRTPFRHGQTFIFVCTHKRRNNNCGIAGPILIQQFKETLEQRKIDNVHVFATSHIGGHRFAGTLIMYPGGDCYGRVLPCHVDSLIDRHILGGHILQPLWRGRVGLSSVEAPPATVDLSW